MTDERPPPGKPPIPRGVEILLHKAAVSPRFREVLLHDFGKAARRIELELSDAEREMLSVMPVVLLEQMIDSVPVDDQLRAEHADADAAAIRETLPPVDEPYYPPPTGIPPDRPVAREVRMETSQPDTAAEPPGLEQPDPRPPRLGGAGVFGVLSIVFGSLTLLMSLSTGCAMGCTDDLSKLDIMMKTSGDNQVKLRQAYERYQKTLLLPTMVSTVLYGSLSALLIAIGAGQLRRRRWASRATLWWSLAAVLTLAASVVMHFAWTSPALAEYTAAQVALLPAADAAAVKVAAQFSGVIMWIVIALEAPYPVIMASYFGRRQVREAMTA